MVTDCKPPFEKVTREQPAWGHQNGKTVADLEYFDGIGRCVDPFTAHGKRA
jgi:hypothetical protein